MTTLLQTAPRIFISHSHKDNDFGLTLVQDLRNALGDDNAVWYDTKGGLHGGDNWWSRIKEELRARSVFIVILSPDSLASQWVKDEIDLAWYQRNTMGKKIIPLLYRQCPLPDELALLHIISFLPPKAYEDALNELLVALELPVGMETKGALGKPDDQAEVFVLQMTPQIQAAFERGKWLQVIQLANLLIQQVPVAVSSIIYEMQGTAYLQTGDFERANDALTSALALVSDSEARLKLLDEHVQVLSTLGRWREVLQHASEALGLVPRNPHWIEIQAEALSKLAEAGQEPSKSMFLAAMRPSTTSVRPTSYTYREHKGWVYDITWSPDSAYIASASADRTVHVWAWEEHRGKRIFTYKGHKRRVNAVSWLPASSDGEEIDTSSLQEWPDGMWIASGSNDKTVQIWNAIDGEPFIVYQGHSDWVNAVAWSPGRTRIASASNDRTVQVWAATTGDHGLTYTQHHYPVLGLARSPHGRRIASAGEKSIHIWYAATGDNIIVNSQHKDWVRAIAWSPDGRYIASASDDRTVQVRSISPNDQR